MANRAKNFSKRRMRRSSRRYALMMLSNLLFSAFVGCMSVVFGSSFSIPFIFSFVVMAFMIASAADDEVYILRIPFKKED